LPFIMSAHLPASLLVLCGLALPAWAAQPLVTDDTGTQGKGGQQIELSQTGDRLRQGADRGRSRASGLTYTLGLSEQLDVFVGSSYQGLRLAGDSPASGWGNPVLGVKWRLWEHESSKTSLALKPEWVLPVSASAEASGLGPGKVSYALAAIVTREMPFGALHVNAAFSRDRMRNTLESERTMRYSVAPVWDLSASWKVALDVGMQTSRSGTGIRLRSRFVEVGAIYSPDKNQDWALGLIRSTDNDSPESTRRTLTGGWTLRF
jgi:hypothetical protein